MYCCQKVNILLKYLNRSIACKICEIFLCSGLEKPQRCPAYKMYGISGNRISRRIVVSQGSSVGSEKERNRHSQDFSKHEQVSFNPQPKRLQWHVMIPWAISKGVAQRRRGPQLQAGLEDTLCLELKEPREKPLGYSLLYLGEFLCFLSYRSLGIYIVERAWESDSRGPVLLWPGYGCPHVQKKNNDMLLGLPRCICHAYAYFILLHNPSQISCLPDSSLPNLDSNIKIPRTLK